MIWEELNASLIFFFKGNRKQEEILRVMGDGMICAGYAKPTFSAALLMREADFPTGIDMRGIGIAIPHTDADHVLREGMAIAVLEQPVLFGRMDDAEKELPVQLIFMVTIQNPQEYMEHLQQILLVLRDMDVLQKLFAAKTPDEVISIIREKENYL